MIDSAAADDGPADLLSLDVFVMPALIADVNSKCIGPVHGTVFHNPVVSAETRNCPALRNRSACRSMFTDQTLHTDIGQKRNLRRKALLPYRNLNQMISGIRVLFQTKMNRLSVCFHPVGILRVAQLVVERHLQKRFTITVYASSAVQIGGHVSLVILNKQAVMQDIHTAERIVSPEHVRIEFMRPDLRPACCTCFAC